MNQIRNTAIAVILIISILLIPRTFVEKDNDSKTRINIKNKIQRIINQCDMVIKSRALEEGSVKVVSQEICVYKETIAIHKNIDDKCLALKDVIDIDKRHSVYQGRNHIVVYINDSSACKIRLEYANQESENKININLLGDCDD